MFRFSKYQINQIKRYYWAFCPTLDQQEATTSLDVPCFLWSLNIESDCKSKPCYNPTIDNWPLFTTVCALIFKPSDRVSDFTFIASDPYNCRLLKILLTAFSMSTDNGFSVTKKTFIWIMFRGSQCLIWIHADIVWNKFKRSTL